MQSCIFFAAGCTPETFDILSLCTLQAHAAPAEEVESGKASSSREQTLQALLDHPNMPEYIRAIYTHIRAKRSGGQGWQWDTGTLLTYYKVDCPASAAAGLCKICKGLAYV